jgi:2-phospho-L-lactate/phosphoenolpyruvate guanylyltransferase
MDALIPLKRLDQAKSRLRGSFTPSERVRLMRTLLDHTIREAGGAPSVSRLILVSSDPDSQAIAADREIAHFDDRGLPWNDALAAAMNEVVVSRSVLILSADLPLVTSEDVEALITLASHEEVAIARARDSGTNGIVMCPPGAARTCFGVKGSAAKHAALAAAAGLSSVTVDIPGLAIDLDSPDDFPEVLRRGAPEEIGALLGTSPAASRPR